MRSDPFQPRFLAIDLSEHTDVGYYSYTDSYGEEIHL